MPSQAPLAELDKKARRAAIVRTILVIAAAWVFCLALYSLVPIADLATTSGVIRVILAMAFFIFMLVWEIRRILIAQNPGLRAIEALGFIIPLFLVLFSMLYLAIERNTANSFSETLDHVKAMYFTVTVLATVGFGDITPSTDAARAVVSVQMILDLILVGAVARLFINAAKFGRARTEGG